MKKCILLAFLATFLAFPVNGEVYKWTDSRGTVHFTDDPSLIPEEHRPKVFETETPPKDEAPMGTEQSSIQRAPVASKDNVGRGEEYWKARIREWQQKQAKAQEQLESLRTQYNELTEKHNVSKNSVVRASLRNERDQVKAQMEECKARINEAKKMLEKTIPEEAALFKANPQWLKP
jgi:peptidoglycan hydrolase CwlO-like protein